MSVDKVNVIDAFSINDTGEVVLTISDHLPWDVKNEHLIILQEKINKYLAFVESGEIYVARPDARGRKVIISIVALYHPTEQARQFLDQVHQIVERSGLGFQFRQKHFNSPT